MNKLLVVAMIVGTIVAGFSIHTSRSNTAFETCLVNHSEETCTTILN